MLCGWLGLPATGKRVGNLVKRPAKTLDEIAQLERTLRWHFPRLLRELEEGPGSLPDPHLAIAGHLRVLLCDRKYPPVLIAYARARAIDLIVYAPRVRPTTKNARILVSWSALIASWEPVVGSAAVKIERYLDTPIGVVQYDERIAHGAPYTPCDVINWVANTEGVSHFNYDNTKHRVHRRLKASAVQPNAVTIADVEIRRILRQIGIWTLQAIDHVVPKTPALPGKD